MLSPAQTRALPDEHPLAPLLDALQRNLAAWYRLFAGLPGMLLEEREEIGWFLSTRGQPGRDVLWTRFEEATCEEGIDRVLRAASRHVEQLDWAIYRSCRPTSLERRLRARGMKPGSVTWMLADLAALPTGPRPGNGFRIELTAQPDQLEAWCTASAAGYGLALEDVAVFRDGYRAHGFGPEQDLVLATAHLGEETVASAALLLAGGIAGVYAVSTPPDQRRRGFGAGITRALLDAALQRGYRHACLMSSAMGLSVYRSVGFDVVVNLPEYSWRRKRWKASARSPEPSG